MTGPLEGVRVVEVGQALAGPLAGAILADMGAEVVKVEKPDGGDDACGWGPPWGPSLGGGGGDTSLYFHGQNRNKLGVTLDLKSAGDVEALHGLCETADILIQNLRPGVVEELGFGPDAMLERHPRLIYCSIWAFGFEGPMRLAPGFDPLLQAYGGMMSLTGRPEDPPTFCGASINDKATGMFCVIGALAALRQRDRTGRGCLVDTSLFETAVHWVEGPLNAYLVDGRVPKRHGTGGAVIVPYQVFETADRPLCLAAGNDRLWARCAAVLGHPEWGTEARFATGPQRVRNKGELIPLIQAIMKERTRAHWLDALAVAGVPSGPVNDIGELAATEQLAAVGILQDLPEGGPRVVGLPISFDRQRPLSARRAPRLGEHNGPVLGRP
ncbi:MAG TPA: CoA transferase [Acetobacteraceae bacterium]|nr:CoA transferase [Acetobacteraceae bacterium]